MLGGCPRPERTVPRRRPSSILSAGRRTRRPDVHRRVPGLPAGSNALAGAVNRLEHERLWDGAVSDAFRSWERVVRAGYPWRDPLCPWKDHLEIFDGRALLERAMHALPRRAARELRRMVTPLDEAYLLKTSPQPLAAPDDPWWLRRFLT